MTSLLSSSLRVLRAFAVRSLTLSNAMLILALLPTHPITDRAQVQLSQLSTEPFILFPRSAGFSPAVQRFLQTARDLSADLMP